MAVSEFRWRRWWLCAATFVVSLLATGCYDRQELEQQAFVTALAVDRAGDGLVDCTFRFAKPQSPSQGGASQSAGDGPLAGRAPVTFRAHSITEAIVIANSSIERQLSLTHLNLVVFGREVAEDGLMPYVQTLTRFREFRPTVFLAVSTGKAREILEAEKPVLEQSPSRMTDSIALTGEKTGLIPVVRVHQFRRYLQSPASGAVLPLFAVNPRAKARTESDQQPQGNSVPFVAGKVARSGGDPVEWMGAAVFRGDKMVGVLNGRESTLLGFLQARLSRNKFDVPDPVRPGRYISLNIRRERAPVYSVTLAPQTRVTADLAFDADIISIQSDVDYTRLDLRNRLEAYLQRELSGECQALLEKILHSYQVDAVPISDQIRRKFRRHADFAAYPWQEHIKDAKVEVRVDLKVRRFGIQLIPS